MKLYWRWNNSGHTSRRVWREDWVGDTFEILAQEPFEYLLAMVNKFGLATVEEAEDDDIDMD